MTKNDLYKKQLRTSFHKLCRLRFLNPDGSTAFSLDNNHLNGRSHAFIEEGSITANLQNGQRRTATVKLNNVGGEFEYNVNKLWFGQEIAIDEGLILQNGEEYYIQQGVFVLTSPEEVYSTEETVVHLNLVDKWAMLDGTLYGNLEGAYEVAVDTNIFEPIAMLLSEDKGNGRPVDRMKPIFTEYYNKMTQLLPDGTEASLVKSPYTLTVNDGTIADVIIGLVTMVNGLVGYDTTGTLRIDPSQDDIDDSKKPVIWQFSPEETTLLGLTYTVNNTDVYNDYIVVGEELDDYTQPAGRAQNYDPKSDTNINLIGRKTIRESASGFATNTQCIDLAAWKLKRSAILQKSVSISCSQIFHIELNHLVTIVRTDKKKRPVERHLVQGFTRPLTSNGNMTINAVSVHDFPSVTLLEWNSGISQ